MQAEVEPGQDNNENVARPARLMFATRGFMRGTSIVTPRPTEPACITGSVWSLRGWGPAHPSLAPVLLASACHLGRLVYFRPVRAVAVILAVLALLLNAMLSVGRGGLTLCFCDGTSHADVTVCTPTCCAHDAPTCDESRAGHTRAPASGDSTWHVHEGEHDGCCCSDVFLPSVDMLGMTSQRSVETTVVIAPPPAPVNIVQAPVHLCVEPTVRLHPDPGGPSWPTIMRSTRLNV